MTITELAPQKQEYRYVRSLASGGNREGIVRALLDFGFFKQISELLVWPRPSKPTPSGWISVNSNQFGLI